LLIAVFRHAVYPAHGSLSNTPGRLEERSHPTENPGEPGT
jgi:hypothetical protein